VAGFNDLQLELRYCRNFQSDTHLYIFILFHQTLVAIIHKNIHRRTHTLTHTSIHTNNIYTHTTIYIRGEGDPLFHVSDDALLYFLAQ